MPSVPSPLARAVPALLVLALLAGCGASAPSPETPTDGSVVVSLSNGHDRPYRVDVVVVPAEVDGLEVTYENGTTRTFDVGSIDALPPPALRNATGLAPVGVDAPTRRYPLPPGSGLGDTIEGIGPGAAVVSFVVAPGDDGLRGAGVSSCGDGADRIEVSIAISGTGAIHSATRCTG